MILCIALLSIAVGILGLLLGNKITTCSGKSPAGVATTTARCQSTATWLVTMTETATNTLEQMTMTSYATSTDTVVMTKVLKETIAICVPSTASAHASILSEPSREKTSGDPAENSTRSPGSSMTPTNQMASKTYKTSLAVSASTTVSADLGDVLHSKCRPHPSHIFVWLYTDIGPQIA